VVPCSRTTVINLADLHPSIKQTDRQHESGMNMCALRGRGVREDKKFRKLGMTFGQAEQKVERASVIVSPSPAAGLTINAFKNTRLAIAGGSVVLEERAGYPVATATLRGNFFVLSFSWSPAALRAADPYTASFG